MPLETVGWVKPSLLRWARERLKLTLEDAVKASSKLGNYWTPVQAEEIRVWEEGQAVPSLEQLETLAEIYVCPVGYFFLDEIPQEPMPLSFRGLASEKTNRLSSNTLRTLLRFFELANWTVTLIEESNLSWKSKIAPRQYSADLSLLDSIVDKERTFFGWTPEVRDRLQGDVDEAFQWWRKKIESLGIFCFQMKLEPRDIRGALLWNKSRYPFILVNHHDFEAATGRLFTLLHEYAHLITATSGIACDFRGFEAGQNPEPFANRFAARMLLPHKDLVQRLRELGEYRKRETWSDTRLDEIRQPFLVSRDVIAIMLEDLGLAPSGFYKTKRVQWEGRKLWYGRGSRKRPTRREIALREVGFSLTRLLRSQHERENLPLLEASYVLGMKVEKVPEFLSWAREHL